LRRGVTGEEVYGFSGVTRESAGRARVCESLHRGISRTADPPRGKVEVRGSFSWVARSPRRTHRGSAVREIPARQDVRTVSFPDGLAGYARETATPP
ncbi:Glucans biosynthesis glucosyltransferase H, partial [Frankliniella fusca]